jgi:hypothetical protein
MAEGALSRAGSFGNAAARLSPFYRRVSQSRRRWPLLNGATRSGSSGVPIRGFAGPRTTYAGPAASPPLRGPGP